MDGFEGYLHLAELPGDILRRSLQSSARQFGQHLLSGRTGDVYARAGSLPDGCQRLFEGRPLAGVRDVQPRLAVHVVSYGFDGEDPSAVFDGRHHDLQPHPGDRRKTV